MKRLLPADCLPCGCISKEMLSSFVSSCFKDWGKYGEGAHIGLTECITHSRSATGTQMLMGVSGSSALVSFRGYGRFHQVLDDVSTLAVPFTIVNSGARVNAIFLNAYMEYRDVLMEYVSRHDLRSVHITGHSMGAAMATIAAVDIASTAGVSSYCYTFGSPKVGDGWFRKVYADKVESTSRYVIPSDPIPHYPWEKDYVHVCRSTLVGSRIEELGLWMGMVKHFFMVMFRMSSKKQRGHVVTNFAGVDAHELYNYAFSVRKLSDDLI